MSFAELKNEIDQLSPEQRQQLRIYLAVKDNLSDDEWIAGLGQKIGDQRPDRWLNLEEFQKQVEG